MELNALVAPVRADVHGGAAEVTLRAIDAYEQVLEGARSLPDMLNELEQLSLQLIDAQRAMAPLLHLAARVLEAPLEEAQMAPARALTQQALDAFRAELRQAPAQVAERAEALIPGGGKVLTVSSSSTVRAALLEAARRRSFSVICVESRPNLEGRTLAADLAQAGLDVTLAPDAAITSLIRSCDVVVVGADSVGDLGVVNKIGTRLAALAARGAGIPVYALADRTKLLPPGVPQCVEYDRPAAEVWADAPPDVHVWNRYFESTPLPFFEGIAMESGLHRPEEAERLRERVRFPPVLLRRIMEPETTKRRRESGDAL